MSFGSFFGRTVIVLVKIFRSIKSLAFQRKNRKKKKKHYKNNKMAGITAYLSILTLNVNGLNSPIKRQNSSLAHKAGLNHLFPARNASY
jgi:hypothetical protein